MGNVICVLLLLPVFCFGQPYSQKNNKIIIGTTDTIHSAILNEEREVLIYVPNTGTGNSSDKTRYPVCYLLDGYSFFHSITGMVQYLSAIGKMPEMIVVAIVLLNFFSTELESSFTIYHGFGKGAGIKLIFSKSRDNKIEDAYATHYVDKKQINDIRENKVVCNIGISAKESP